MTEPRTDHRVKAVLCGHDEDNCKDSCELLKNTDKCPDKECMGWVD